MFLLGCNILYLLFLIFPFTRFAKKQVFKITTSLPGQDLSIMIANVYQDNRNTAGCLNQIYSADPDIVLLLEANNYWFENTVDLKSKYPYSVEVPLENTYGMLLYSKLELSDSHIEYLVEQDIPSIHTKVSLKDGTKVQIYAVHPTPPVPGENPRSTERDKELLLVADLARKSQLPVIVMGDLNDVAWSYTTELFLKMSGLLDPRRGRGFFNTFHAHYFFMRFPLDHAFVDTNFKLVDIKRLDNFGSDHFPIFIKVQYEKHADEEQKALERDVDDIALAAEKKQKI
ncbi:endonuclease/exonuclease/phosphatase family protein [Flavobacterium sp. RHBU_24]|uniref:endonuclease/exonuclease/phosphatase family protein n=1 Tax=Flavobacterium sp. RHBU_24 TaxID=3391185 RepID=UPI0039846ADE